MTMSTSERRDGGGISRTSSWSLSGSSAAAEGRTRRTEARLVANSVSVSDGVGVGVGASRRDGGREQDENSAPGPLPAHVLLSDQKSDSGSSSLSIPVPGHFSSSSSSVYFDAPEFPTPTRSYRTRIPGRRRRRRQRTRSQRDPLRESQPKVVTREPTLSETESSTSDDPLAPRPLPRLPWIEVDSIPRQDDPAALPEAFVAALEPEQSEAVAALGARVRASSNPVLAGVADDLLLLYRHLQAMHWDSDTAMELLVRSQTWRLENRPEDYLCELCLANPQCHGLRLVGYDLQHRPILYMHFKDYADRDNDNMIRHAIVCLEAAIAAMPPGVQQWIWVTDFAGFGFSWMKPALAKQYASLFNDFYAERLAITLLLEPPGLFRGMWNIARRVAEPETVAKVRFLNSKSEIDEEFDKLFAPRMADALRQRMLQLRS